MTAALALHLNGIALVRDDGRGQLADTLAAMRVFGDVTEGLVATQMTALAIHLVTAGVGVLHEGVVKDLRLAAVTAHALFTAAHAVGHDRVIVHDPVANIEVVDVLLADLVAAGPDEVVPVVALELHIGHARLTVAIPNAATVPVNAHQVDFTDGAVMQHFNVVDIALLVAAL